MSLAAHHHLPAPSVRPALLRRRDLGTGWSVAQPAPARAPGLTCRGFSPRLAHVRRLTAGASATFRQAGTDTFVSETVYLYGTPAMERTVWHDVVTRRLERCVAAQLGGSSGGTRFTVTGRRMQPLVRNRRQVTRYRVSATASGGGQSLPAFLDQLMVQHGRAIAALAVTSVDQPPSDAVERRLIGVIADRLRRLT